MRALNIRKLYKSISYREICNESSPELEYCAFPPGPGIPVLLWKQTIQIYINCQKGASAYTELLLLFFAHLHSNYQQRTVLVYFLCLNRSSPKIDRHQFDIDLERTITVYHHHQQQPYTRRATTAQRRQRITAKSNKLNHFPRCRWDVFFAFN